jgi:uncharacterized phage-associated protein
MKLQKLLYYCQAWFLVWEKRPLFSENIEAWRDGPVVREVWSRDASGTDATQGATPLPREAQETIRAVLQFYGTYDGDFLSEVTHRELPWLKARVGIERGERGNLPLSHSDMMTFYGQVPAEKYQLPNQLRDALAALVGMDEDAVEDLLLGTNSTDVDGESYLRFLETGDGVGGLPIN